METGCYGRANTCHLCLLLTNYANFSKICLLLEHEVIYTHASVYIHLLNGVTGVFSHSLYYLLGAQAWCLEEGPSQMAALSVNSDTDYQATGIVSPVRRKNSVEGWHEVDVTTIFDRCSQVLKFPR